MKYLKYILLLPVFFGVVLGSDFLLDKKIDSRIVMYMMERLGARTASLDPNATIEVGTVSTTNMVAQNVTTTNLAVTGQFSIPVGGVALETFSVVNAGRTATTSITSGSVTVGNGASGYIALGAAPASTGLVRLSNNQGVVSRNAANTGDLSVMYVNASNQTVLGHSTGPVVATGDFGFLTDNASDIGGGLRNPRGVYARTHMTAGTTTQIATLGAQGIAGTTPFKVSSSTTANLLTVTQNGNILMSTAAESAAINLLNNQAASLVELYAQGDNNTDIYSDGSFNLRLDANNNNTSVWALFNGGNNQVFNVNETGQLGINSSTPNYQMVVNQSSEGNTVAIQDTDGLCLLDPDSASLVTSCSSDENLKKDIRPAADVLGWVDTIPVKDFTIKSSGLKTTGVIAQQIKKTHPELSPGKELVVQEVSTWKLVKAIQELSTQNKAQDEKIAALEKLNPTATRPWYTDYWKLAFVVFVGLSLLGKVWKKLTA